MTDTSGHIPVLIEQVLDVLNAQPGHIVLDCTVGRAGHAAQLIEAIKPAGTYIGLDVDPANVAFAAQKLRNDSVTTHIVQANFARARQVLDDLHIDRVDRVLADLGFATTQMTDPSRGLSFAAGGPLDMRLDPTLTQSAADLVNGLPQHELADLIYEFGEERMSRRIAKKIVEMRHRTPIKSTDDLAKLVRDAIGPAGRRQRIDPATRTFQALRIAVNGELAALDQLLSQLPTLVRPEAIAAVISFHSLEDRRVKQAFVNLQRQGDATRLTKKPITATDAQRYANPPSRSAKLRAIQFSTTHAS